MQDLTMEHTQVIWLGCKYLYSLSPLRGPGRHFIHRLIFKASKKNRVCLSCSPFATIKYHEKSNWSRKGWFCLTVPEGSCPSKKASCIRVQGKHDSRRRSLVDQCVDTQEEGSGVVGLAHKASLLIPSFLWQGLISCELHNLLQQYHYLEKII